MKSRRCVCVDNLLDGDVLPHHVPRSAHLSHYTQLPAHDDAATHATQARLVAVQHQTDRQRQRPVADQSSPVANQSLPVADESFRGRDHPHAHRRHPGVRLLSESGVHHPGAHQLLARGVTVLSVLPVLLHTSQRPVDRRKLVG